MIASAAIVALLLSDFMHPAATTEAPKTVTSYSETGQGELLVSVDSSGVFGSVPKGASRVELMTLNFSASCNADVTVESVSVRHIGLGDVSDIDSVYLTSGYRRLSRARAFDSGSKTADLRTPHFVIPKCGAVRATLLADFSRDASVASEHGAALDQATSVQSDAKSVTVTQGEPSRTVTPTPDRIGNVTVEFLPVNSRLRYGRTETVARIQLTADSRNDFLLKHITLTNASSARDMDLINLKIETRRGDVLTAPVQRMKGKTASFDFDPTYILERGQTVVLLVTAQINGSQSRKVQFGLEEPSDLDAVLYRARR